MYKKFLSALCCLLAFLLFLLPSAAAEQAPATDKAQQIIEQILSAKRSDRDPQAWINQELTQNAGSGAEWYVLALSQSGNYDFSTYEQALLQYLSQHRIPSAATRQKYALTLAAIGSTNSYISTVMNHSVGELGTMSYVFGLHLLNNGYTAIGITVSDTITKLLSLQLADGAWTNIGSAPDVDVTAMAVQALAPHCSRDPAVQAAVDAALSALSAAQQPNGDFISYGVANPESTAQVLTALSALGIDAAKDARFIKNGKNLLDVIENYRLNDGSYCHTLGGNTNENATSQVFYSMVAYLRMQQGLSPLFLLDHAKPEAVEPEPSSADTAEPPAQEPPSTEPDAAFTDQLWAVLAILLLSGLIGAILFFKKKRHRNNWILLAVATVLAIGFVLLTDFRSAEDYYNGRLPEKPNAVGEVTVSIRCNELIGKADPEAIPANGMLLPPTAVAIAQGDTVYDILIEVARAYGIRIENNGSASMAYISGIQSIYEFDYGSLSGWIYLVNGEQTSVSCSEYQLSDGDRVEWVYSLNLGQVKANAGGAK